MFNALIQQQRPYILLKSISLLCFIQLESGLQDWVPAYYVVVTLSFNAKMVLANFECNLKDKGIPEMAPRR